MHQSRELPLVLDPFSSQSMSQRRPRSIQQVMATLRRRCFRAKANLFIVISSLSMHGILISSTCSEWSFRNDSFRRSTRDVCQMELTSHRGTVRQSTIRQSTIRQSTVHQSTVHQSTAVNRGPFIASGYRVPFPVSLDSWILSDSLPELQSLPCNRSLQSMCQLR